MEPYSERIWANKGLILLFSRRYLQAVGVFNNSIARFSDNSQLFLKYKTECHYLLGQKDSVLYFASAISDSEYNYKFWQAVCTQNKIQLHDFLTVKAAAKSLDNETAATYYAFMNDKQRALKRIQDAYNNKEFGWLIYLNVSPTWDVLHKEKEFQDVISKLGLN